MPDAIPLWPTPQQPENPTLTPYLLPGERTRAMLVILPGGGYEVRVDHEKLNIVRWVNSLGLHAAICDYRVKPARHPAPLHDAQRALRLIRHHAAEWHVDPGRIGVIGFSAGGHLAGSVGNFGDDGNTTSPDLVARQSGRADAVIACYAVISGLMRSGSFKNLLGPDPDAELVQRLSLETSVTARNPPTFLWSTAADPVVSVEHSLRYASALHAKGIPFALHVYPKGGHGMALAPEDAAVSDWTGRCANWLAELGWR
ncbi:MAG: alpha/beta hydrolase [Planctomycetes bacterium]|nr:alpha/beta hydrolase [Planctomycetota bacterium]